MVRACSRKMDWAGSWRLDCGWGEGGTSEEPDATLQARRDERHVRVEREVDIRLASLGNRWFMVGKGEEGGVREDSAFESRGLGGWQCHSRKLGTPGVGRGRR